MDRKAPLHPFRKFISNYTTISNEDWARIERVITRKEYGKGVTLLEQGKVCKKLYFLESGFLRYYVVREGEDITKFFTEPPYCFTSQRSFTQNIPAQESIEALEHSVIWEMSKANADDLLEMGAWNNFIRQLVQEVQFYTEQILVAIQNETAEQRYVKMITERSILLQKVPLKHLASYLGIAPQSLSRIRKKFFEERPKLT
ncbi:MAG: Crp/Fnr family transcriptional regulator [Cytophagales bacterium]|nr:Crp/Fnr family transcriptional regulator [Cytophagales bacterium]